MCAYVSTENKATRVPREMAEYDGREFWYPSKLGY